MRQRTLQFGAITCCAILSFATLTACGSDDASDTGSTAAPSQAEASAETSPGAGADDAASVPNDFPSDVPLPDGVALTSATGSSDAGFSLEYEFAADSSQVLADYRDAVAAAGFTVPDGAGVFTATGNDWTIETRTFWAPDAPEEQGLAVIVTPVQ